MSIRHAPGGVAPWHWQPRLEQGDASVETLTLRPGASLVLSRFGAGHPRAFEFEEPGDMFGFGFHLKAGARFRVETLGFETRALDVWACALPRGATTRFVLPARGFHTVAVRFEPDVAEAFFDGGGALPRRAQALLRTVREKPGLAQLGSLPPAAAARLMSMFTTGFGGAARRLYLESCLLELLASQIAGLEQENASPFAARARHREKALAARDHLDRHFRDPPTIRQLARIVGSNEFTLKRAFKEAFGRTLFAHVSARRMEQAELLLRQGMTVAMAAEAVGYECVRSFSSAFRRHFGRSPSSMRPASR